MYVILVKITRFNVTGAGAEALVKQRLRAEAGMKPVSVSSSRDGSDGCWYVAARCEGPYGEDVVAEAQAALVGVGVVYA